jgi:putative nucleotidyltransferase with HDIG domain
MTKKHILALRKWFKDYVNGFLGDDPYTNENVALKEGHTYRVCGHCAAVARSLNLSREKQYLAETMGLFHDIGRFEQFEKYRTFNDKASENHAELGARVLRRENILSQLNPTEQTIILKGVQFHSMKDVPENESEAACFFLKILRDADKLDILNVLTNYYNSRDNGSNPALDLDLPDTPEISEAVLQDLMEKRCVNLKHVRRINDFKLLQISWVFDVNFDYTLRYIKTHRYIEKIINALPRTIEVQRVYNHINDYLSAG